MYIPPSTDPFVFYRYKIDVRTMGIASNRSSFAPDPLYSFSGCGTVGATDQKNGRLRTNVVCTRLLQRKVDENEIEEVVNDDLELNTTALFDGVLNPVLSPH